jgi:hypothetical protein
MPLLLNLSASDPAQVFSASKSLVREMGPCLVTGNILSVSGKRIAGVAKAGQAALCMPSPDGEKAFHFPSTEDIFDSCRSLDPVYSLTRQDRVEVQYFGERYWLTAVADLVLIAKPNTHELKNFTGFWSFHCHFVGNGESQYTLVGEAYVHGIMHGELIDAPGGTEGFKEI